MKEHFEAIIREVGEDEKRPGLLKTPERAAKAIEFLTSGYRQDLVKIVNDALFPSESNEMVVVKNIEFFSLCEHHLLPFYGRIHIGYIPQGKILGLSKFARISDLFARRLQVQENLTNQIAKCVYEVTDAAGAICVIEASHMCLMMRGVEKQSSMTTTAATYGIFRDNDKVNDRFYKLLNH